MPEFKSGEIVDVTIKGVRVDDQHPDGTVTIIADHSDGGTATWQMPPQAAIGRVAPAEWPPQPGDLWKDEHGSFWFAFWGADACEVFMVPSDPARGELNTPMPDRVLLMVGPLTLVHREDQAEVSET